MIVKPTSPAREWPFGHARAFSSDPLGFFETCAREHGDFVPIDLAGWKCALLFHPDLIRQALTVRHAKLIKMRSMRSPLLKRIFGNGLNTSEGEFWARQRALAQPAFHRRKMAPYAEIMVGHSKRMLDGWASDEVRDVDADMMRLTLSIVTQTLFDLDLGEAQTAAGQALAVLMAEYETQFGTAAFLDRLFVTPSALRARRAIATIDAMIYAMIAERRAAASEGKDLLSLLVHARDEQGQGMSDEQLRDEVMTFLFGGHETTALSLTWTFHLLAQHPERAAAVAASVRALLGERDATLDDVRALTACEYAIKEAMRLFPPIFCVGRETREPIWLMGHRLEAGVQLLMPQWVVHRDPRFFDRPLEFLPERWEPAAAASIPRHAYFPFGAGPRICIGANFSMVEAVLILATVLQRFDIEAVPERQVTPWATLTLRPRDGLRVRVRARA